MGVGRLSHAPAIAVLSAAVLVWTGAGCDSSNTQDGKAAAPSSGSGKQGAKSRAKRGRYRTAEVSNSGTISVGAIYTGEDIPIQSEVPVDTNVGYCGHKVLTDDVIVDKQSRGLKNVVVRLDGIFAGKAPIQQVTITNRNCMFDPHVAVAMKRTKIKIRNADPILHTTHPYLNGKSFFNIALINENADYAARPIRKAGLMEIRCDVHNWMRAYVVVHTNPYIGLTNGKGRLTLDQVPPGTHPYIAWHEKLGELRGEVTVLEGKSAEVKLEFAPRK